MEWRTSIKQRFKIHNKIKINNNNNKIFKLFEIGFTHDTICYLKNLSNIITNYFI
jgi:hypothetical protein